MVSIRTFCAFRCSSWFFLARFGFSSSDVRCCFLLLSVAFFAAFRCPSLHFLAFHCSWHQPPSIGPELVRMNENGNEKCSLLLFVTRFGFWCVFPFPVRCLLLLFVALSCFWDRMNSISKTKTDKCLLLLVMAFCCSFWFFVDLSIWTSHCSLWLFCWYEKPKRARKGNKSPNGNQA